MFEAYDPIGERYLALEVDSQDAADQYLVVGVAPGRLCQFRAGMGDLGEIIAGIGREDWYLVIATDGLDHPLEIERKATFCRIQVYAVQPTRGGRCAERSTETLPVAPDWSSRR